MIPQPLPSQGQRNPVLNNNKGSVPVFESLPEGYEFIDEPTPSAGGPKQESLESRALDSTVNTVKELGVGAIGGNADLINMGLNVFPWTLNKVFGLNIPYFPTDVTGQLEKAWGASSNDIGGQGAQFVGSLVGPVGAVSVVKGAAKKLTNVVKNPALKETLARMGSEEIQFLKKHPFLLKTWDFLTSKDPKVLASAALGGEAMSWARREDVGPLGQIAAGIGGSVGANALISAGKNANLSLKEGTASPDFKNFVQNDLLTIPRKAKYALMGLSPKSINEETIKGANRLGIDLPAAAISHSPQTSFFTQIGKMVPSVSEAFVKNIEKTHQKFKSAFETLSQKIYPDKSLSLGNTETYKNKLNEVYEPLIDYAAKSDVFIDYKKTVEAAYEFLNKNRTGSNATEMKEALARARNIVEHGQQYLGKQYKVPLLEALNQKKNLNAMMFPSDKMILTPLKPVRDAVIQDLKNYGEKDPFFAKLLREADSNYYRIKNRETFEKNFEDLFFNKVDGIPAYGQIFRKLSENKSKQLLKKVVGKEQLGALEDLKKAAEGMASVSSKVLNPSGTAVLSMLGDIVKSPIKSSGSIGASMLFFGALKDPSLAKKALKFSKTPTSKTAQEFSKTFEKSFGLRVKEFYEAFMDRDSGGPSLEEILNQELPPSSPEDPEKYLNQMLGKP